MAKKDTKDSTDLATIPVAQALMERPSFLAEEDTRGTENIRSSDIRPPALRIAQSMTPQTKRSDPSYVEGLLEGHFFNTLTNENFGEGPLEIVILNQLGARYVEFEPGNTGVVLDFNVPEDDPRAQFTSEIINGVSVRVKPRATKFYDYLILLVQGSRRTMMTLSLKSTQLKKAMQLNTILKTLKAPSFALRFSVTSVAEKKGNNNFYGWKFQPAGWVDESLYREASDLYDTMADKTIVPDVDVTPELEEDPFS